MRLIAGMWISWSLGSWFAILRADEPIQIQPTEPWSNVFAESETRWTYRVTTTQPLQERAAWRLAINQRTAASGEWEVRAAADQPATTSVTLRWPKVKEGVVQTAVLTVSLGEITHARTVSIFPRDPFADRRDWLTSLALNLFDPVGETAQVFKDLDIPHRRLRSREALDDVSEGIIIVGEEVSLTKHDGLIDDLRNLAARGVPVLCLALDDGEFAFPGDRPSALALQLRRSDVIRELDKRLDAVAWPKHAPFHRGLRIGSSADDVVAAISDQATAWPWCEWQFQKESAKPDKPTRFIWCGFGIIRSWDDSPTPRYLLAKLLERLSLDHSDESSVSGEK